MQDTAKSQTRCAREPHADSQRAALLDAIERAAPPILELSRWMGEHPELSLAEHRTSQRYREYLVARGFGVDACAAGLETAFVATWGDTLAPFTVALLAEMDALPEIGHACGHNLSGPASLLAASALRDVADPKALRILVVGCPAEETGQGKPRLVQAGIFEAVDAAMLAHASDMRRAHRLFLGNRKLEFVFHGRAAHAAAYPEKGINALDAVVNFFVGIGLLRQQLPRGVRVHGVISDGGHAPNVIPERAAARVWIRALEDDVLEAAVLRVRDCAEGAAKSTNVRLEVNEEVGGSPPMRPNVALADCYRRQLDRLGLVESGHTATEAIGSSDITHVSRVVPTIHPNFPIGTRLALHTREFAQATLSPQGQSGLLEGARAMGLCVLEMTRDPALREEVRRIQQEHPASE